VIAQGSPNRYSVAGQVIHWVTALLVVVAFFYGPGGSEARVYEASRDFDRQLHETLGITILMLTIFRVFWRLTASIPEQHSPSRWVKLGSKLVQLALYALLFALPVTAIAGAWLEGHPLTLIAGVGIPPLLAEHHLAGQAIATIHTWLGDTILWVAGLHALAGLGHHFLFRDGVLASMLPRWALRDGSRYNSARE
jgi:cytochrome b561